MQPSTQGIKYPKLRSRQQLTIKYKQIREERDTWRELRDTLRARYPDRPRIIARLERYIDDCEAQLDILLYALNGQV
jgi:hypothetical protein